MSATATQGNKALACHCAVKCADYGAQRTAHFSSPAPRYRYSLEICWSSGGLPLHALLLNPSTATHLRDDPTVKRMVRRAERAGYGALIVTNLFALRSTDPFALARADDPVGPENDAHILHAARRAVHTLCGWGDHGTLGGRSAHVYNLLRAANTSLLHLGLNKSGEPRHPLYISYAIEPAYWIEADL